MLQGRSLQTALKQVTPRAFEDTLYRRVSLRALLGLVKDPTGKLLITRPNPDFLYAGGPVIGGGRFTPKGGARSLYMAETSHTAKLEKRQAAGFRTLRRKKEPIEVDYALEVKLSITKAGNSLARWLLTQAARQVAQHPGPLGVFFRRIEKRKNLALCWRDPCWFWICWHWRSENPVNSSL